MSGSILRVLTQLRQALERIVKLKPGWLVESFPQIDWKGAMGFRDVIAHQYFDLDDEQVLLICRDALPGPGSGPSSGTIHQRRTLTNGESGSQR